MKIKVGDRVLAVFVALLVLGVGVFFILGALNIISLDMVTTLVQAIGDNWVNALILGLVGLALAILGICLMAGMFAKGGTSARYVMLKNTDSGGIYASVETIRQVIKLVVEKAPEVLRHRIMIHVEKEAVLINLILGLKPETVVPDFSSDLQDKVKSIVQTTMGIEVAQVKITVDNHAAGTKD